MGDMDKGFILLHRKLMENPIWADPYYLKLWIYCLFKASHQELEQLVGNQMVQLQRGQFVTGRFQLSNELNKGVKPNQQLNARTWWRYLKNLERWGMLSIKSSNKYSIVTIEKYDFYQIPTNKDDQELVQQLSSSFEDFSSETVQQSVQQKETKKPDISTFEENKKKKLSSKVSNSCPANVQQMSTNNKEYINNNIYIIFNHWVSKDIIKHKSLNKKMERHISARLKEYSVEELCKAIDNYNIILKSDLYFWTYRWTLQDFMKPNNVERFLDSSRPFETFKNGNSNQKQVDWGSL